MKCLLCSLSQEHMRHSCCCDSLDFIYPHCLEMGCGAVCPEWTSALYLNALLRRLGLGTLSHPVSSPLQRNFTFLCSRDSLAYSLFILLYLLILSTFLDVPQVVPYWTPATHNLVKWRYSSSVFAYFPCYRPLNGL